jgi:hypothetical protein
MGFVHDEFLLATRVGRPGNDERLAKALAENEARRARVARRKQSEKSTSARPKASRVVAFAFGRTRRQQYR